MALRKFLKSFGYAAAGVAYSLRTQRNMRVHFAAALLALALALYFQISARDLVPVLFAVTLVIMAEMINTAIEAVVDLYVQTEHPLARIAKDVAAGAVLVAALNSIAVAIVVFYPYLAR
ncbi:diacylglycerol kinase family protein [Pelotomaculum sp. PtaB.Bin117]|uniref:diacylglycerol kinase n=1 Tax=Pelotomaculum sp. PtaB.Bin117 TaxID=1811694 RepID=UPI0009C6F556|nr:diacylglycerol kinase family protein [Pelotomaculum sp. PtaB.Bin117]OPX87073.1 MAG: Undecaprenol kinase [Pelotomaculum sp. PtaB.Bin117]